MDRTQLEFTGKCIFLGRVNSTLKYNGQVRETWNTNDTYWQLVNKKVITSSGSLTKFGKRYFNKMFGVQQWYYVNRQGLTPRLYVEDDAAIAMFVLEM